MRLEGVPGLRGERAGDVVVLGVENLVPEGVQLVDFIVILEGEVVSAFITCGELSRVEVFAVEGLDEVADVVDEEAEGIRLGDVLIVSELGHEVGVHITGLVIVTLLAGEPRDDIVQGNCEVSVAVNDVIVRLFALDDVDQVLEVVVCLPVLTVVLGVVGEGRTLYEAVLVLVVGLLRVVLFQVGQQFVGGSQGVWSVLLKEIMGDVGHKEMSVDGPGARETRKQEESGHDNFHGMKGYF